MLPVILTVPWLLFPPLLEEEGLICFDFVNTLTWVVGAFVLVEFRIDLFAPSFGDASCFMSNRIDLSCLGEVFPDAEPDESNGVEESDEPEDKKESESTAFSRVKSSCSSETPDENGEIDRTPEAAEAKCDGESFI